MDLLYDDAQCVLGMAFADAATVEELTTVTYENVATKLRGSLGLPWYATR